MEEPTEFTSDSDSKPRKRLSAEMIVAVTAIIVSVMTLFVYVFQARIMMEQQHTSVWPYVEWTMTSTSDTEDELYISVINKGVGPALVKDTQLSLDEKLYGFNEYRDFMKEFLGSEGRRDSLWIIYSTVENRVMTPGEEIKILHVKSWKGARIPSFDYKRLKYSICYCSIYGDCWTTDGTVSKESECK